MGSEDTSNQLERFDDWVVAYHEALKDGAATPPPTLSASPDWQARMSKVRACLDLLERACPRSPGTSDASSAPPEAVLVPGLPWPRSIGRFRIVKPLGQGGFGIVFLAYDEKLQREVALKVPRGDTLLNPELRRRFLFDAHAAGRLTHPNIVPVHEAGETGGILYIVSEYCPGITLDQWLKDGPQPAPPRQAAELVATLAEAVHYIHSRGFLHRDLKPANILLVSGGVVNREWSENTPHHSPLTTHQPKITDFGLAKLLDQEDSQTRTGAVLGTPCYMAPEQVLGQRDQTGWHTDVYALGVILYELLAGRPPFRGDSDPATHQLTLTAEPEPLRNAPRDLETVCLKCLRKEPAQRYTSALALREDLERFLTGHPITARPIPLGERAWKWTRRHPARAALLVVILVSVIGFSFLAWQWRGAAEREALERAKTEAAEQTAVVKSYHSLVNSVAERIANPEPGWTWKGLEDLQEANRLNTDVRDLLHLRRLAVQCLAGIDLRPVAEFAQGIDAFCIAFSPDGTRLAVGENYGSPSAVVLVYDVASRRLLHEFRFRSLSGADEAGVQCLSFSPDGRRLAMGSRTGDMFVWDISRESKDPVCWNAHQLRVRTVVFHPSGQWLLSGGLDWHIKIWDPTDGTMLHCHERPGRDPEGMIRELVFPPDGHTLLSAGAEGILRFEVEGSMTGKPTLKQVAQHGWGAMSNLCLSPDGRTFAFPLEFGVAASYIPPDPKVPIRGLYAGDDMHRSTIRHMDFNPAGSLLVSGAQDRRVKMWPVGTRRPVVDLLVEGHGNVYPIFSPDGRHLAVTRSDKTLLYEVSGLDIQSALARHQRPVVGATFTADGRTLACISLGRAGSMDQLQTEVTLWNSRNGAFQAGKMLEDQRLPLSFTACMALHPEGDVLAFRPRVAEGMVLWVARSGQILELPNAPVTSGLCFDRSGHKLWGVVGYQVREKRPDGSWNSDLVTCWSYPAMTVVSELDGIRGIECVTAGDRWLLLGSRRGNAKVVRSDPGNQVYGEWPSPDGFAVQSVALNADETVAALGTQTGAVQVRRVPDGKVIAELRGHRDTVHALAFSPDGQLLASASQDKTVRLWQAHDHGYREVLTIPLHGPVTAVCFSPDSTGMAVVVDDEHVVRFWHLDHLRARLNQMGLGW